MTTKLKVTIFNVNKCGYYRRNEKKPSFSGLSDTLLNLSEWVKGKTLLQTATFAADGEEVMESYCFDIRSGLKNNYLFTTWNKIPMAEGGVQTANPLNTVGNVSVKLAEVVDGNIPGYPAFFYFIPSKDLCVALRPHKQAHNGHQPLIRYMNGFLEKFSKYTVFSDESDPDGYEILGYSVDGNIDEENSAFPAYTSHPKRLPGQEQYLKANRHLIRKMVKKDKLDLNIQANKSLIDKILSLTGIQNTPTTKTKELNFKYEIQLSPSEEEFDEIVKKYKSVKNGSTEIGFKLIGNSSEVFWLSHINAKGEIEVGIDVDENGILSSEKLIAEIEKSHLPRLLQLSGDNA